MYRCLARGSRRRRGELLACFYSMLLTLISSKGTSCKLLACFSVKKCKPLTNLPWVLCSLLDSHDRDESCIAMQHNYSFQIIIFLFFVIFA